jgi:hypothetical protein
VQFEKTAIREILTELIEKNGETIKTFNTFLGNLKIDLNERFKNKQTTTKIGKRIEQSYHTVLDIIFDTLRYNQYYDIIQEIKDRIFVMEI